MPLSTTTLRDRRRQVVLRHSPLDVAVAGDMKDVEKRLGAGADPGVEDPAGKPSLHDAAKLCRPELAELLLKHGADPNAIDNQGKTPLYYAAVFCCVEVAELLLRHGADVKRGNPLYEAVSGGCRAVAELLLRHGADPNMEDGWGIPLYAAVWRRDAGLVELLLRHGADPNVRDSAGNTALHRAAENGVVDVAAVLLRYGADPNARNREGRTPLHVAAERCRADLVELLLRHGGDPNARSARGGTPLYYAANCGVEVVRILLAAGAAPDAEAAAEAAERCRFDVLDLFPDISAAAGVLLRSCGGGGVEYLCRRGVLHPFLCAAAADDAVAVEELLKQGADPNMRDPLGRTALHIAAELCRPNAAKTLLAHGADPNARDERGRTPLHHAACLDVADLLIRYGADVNAGDGEGYTPATHAFMRGDLDLAAFLLAHGAVADVEAAESPDGVALAGDGIPAGEALLQAVVFAEEVDAVYLLLSRGADPNVRGWRGQTPLHLAIVYEGTSNCRMKAVWLLLKHGADPNARDEHGKTPLHYAAKHCMPNLVELLLKHGADPNARDAEGRTPLYLVFERAAGNRWERVMAELTAAALLRHGADPNARDSEGRTPLHYAAARNSLYLKAAEVLVRHGADVNARDRLGRTPLYYAEDGSAVEYLIRRGADPNVRDAEGKTPLHHAVASGRRWAAKALVEAGAEVDEDLAAALRLTPLHLAALRGDAEEAERLLSRGADPNARDVFGRTPLHYAAARNHKAVAELLLKHGADPNAEDGETPLDLAAKWCAAETGALLAAYGSGPFTLSYAVEAGCVDLVKALPPVDLKQALFAAAWFCDVDVARVLLERGAEADALEAALESAVAAGCVEVVELLLSMGARLRAGLFSLAEDFRRGEVVKVLAKYADKETLEKALSNCFVMALAVKTPEEAARLLGRGASGCRAREVEPLLNLGVDPNLRDEEGLTPLHRALMHNDLYNAEVVDLLLRRGADPNVRGRDGNTPLHLAAEFNRVQAVALLLKHGADPDARNARGETPLHIAAGEGRYAVAYLLLQHGADPNARDAEGNTPLHRVAANCRYALAQLLIQHGADPNAKNNQDKTPADLLNCPKMARAFRRLSSGDPR